MRPLIMYGWSVSGTAEAVEWGSGMGRSRLSRRVGGQPRLFRTSMLLDPGLVHPPMAGRSGSRQCGRTEGDRESLAPDRDPLKLVEIG